MESEQSQNFNERLSQWVADQGFWFQVRYSLSGSGSRGTLMFHVLRLGMRLLILLLLLAAGTWVYLLKRTESPKYAENLKQSIQASLGGADTEMSGFARKRGRLEMGRIIGEGGSQTFYNSLEARNIRCSMGVLDGVFGKWDPGPISISSVKMELRPGADDAASARALSEALFRQNDKFAVTTVEVGSATLSWGYSERTRGSIENSTLTMNRIGSGWRMTFTGGKFSQNWLRDLEITSLVALVDPDGLTLEKAQFRRGRGEVDLSGLRLTGGERPSVSGTARIRSLSLEDVIPTVLSDFMEGSFSGDFEISGSTNTAEGIGFEGLVALGGQDSVILRERLHLLEALSVVDYVRNYRRLEFSDGSFRLKTGNGEIKVSDINLKSQDKLKSQDIFTLGGNLLVRPPTSEEKKEDAAKALAEGKKAPIFYGNPAEMSATDLMTGSELSLNDADNASYLGLDRESKIKALSLTARIAAAAENRQLEQKSVELAAQYLRYEGSLLITLLPDAFELAPKLVQRFPMDSKTGRIPIEVPIRGTIFQVTEEQAKLIYQQRTR